MILQKQNKVNSYNNLFTAKDFFNHPDSMFYFSRVLKKNYSSHMSWVFCGNFTFNVSYEVVTSLKFFSLNNFSK